MSSQATGAELRFEQPGVPSGTVVGTAEITADGPETQTVAVVTSGVPVRVRIPTRLGYSVQGRLTSGERLTGYAAVDGNEPWVLLPLAVLSDGPQVAVPAKRFPDAPWAAGWTWDIQSRRFVSSHWLATLKRPEAGVFLTSGLQKATHAVQVSPLGGPASFVLLPAETPLWVTGDRLEPEPGLAATLLSCLRRADLSAAEAVAAEVLRIRDSIDSPSRILLDLALGYFMLDADDDRLTHWSDQLTDSYDWCADAHVIAAHTLLRRPGGHGKSVAERLENALACGLPVITQGLQLLNDCIDLIPGPELAVRRAVLPYAVCARTDTDLTTFWGELPDVPRGMPILGEQPPHALTLGVEAGPVERFSPIAAPVKALVESLPAMPHAVRIVLADLRLNLEESLRLASCLSLARTAPEIVGLGSLLKETLRHVERPTAVLAARLAKAGTTDRSAGSAAQQKHDQQAFGQMSAALAKANRTLQIHANAADRARSQEHAQAQAVNSAATSAAHLAVDIREAVSMLRKAGVEVGGGSVRPVKGSARSPV
ncbi:hypothetical protein [Streptomyces prunicolor]|uniref:hypothetical protein n=1 Tax=Streptomyces prunicolor TaxID=67348 RepID=UPI00036F64B9|nr:hypothetical protein [Streptomyces prunicolor]